MKAIFSIIVCIVLASKVLSFQAKKSERGKITEASSTLGKAFLEGDIDGLNVFFDVDSYILPEYHKILNGTKAIASYFREFFSKTETISYQKHHFEIQKIGELYIELGTFKHRYKTPTDSIFDYNGKYTAYWKLENGSPKIKALIWGASGYFEAENLNFINIKVPNSKTLIPKTTWENDIEAQRKYVYEAVLEGNAEQQMTTYAEDAVYMTYYDPPFIGKTQITSYFNSHYIPDAPMDALTLRNVKVIDLGDHALKFGEYRVEWTAEDQPYFIEGKGLTLYKRLSDNSIKIYRQMINHSIPPTPKPKK